MKIGDRIFVRGYIDEIRKDTVIVRNDGGYFGTTWNEVTPSAQQERKKGTWLMHSDFPGRLICSECGAQFDVWHWESEQMHFCPNCGAKMDGKDGDHHE